MCVALVPLAPGSVPIIVMSVINDKCQSVLALSSPLTFNIKVTPLVHWVHFTHFCTAGTADCGLQHTVKTDDCWLSLGGSDAVFSAL